MHQCPSSSKIYVFVKIFCFLIALPIHGHGWILNFYHLLTVNLTYSENGEGLQILHYEVGQKYEPHYDYFLDEFNTKNGGQRIATVLMYL